MSVIAQTIHPFCRLLPGKRSTPQSRKGRETEPVPELTNLAPPDLTRSAPDGHFLLAFPLGGTVVMIIELPWGNGVLPIPIPPGWRLLGSFFPRALTAAEDCAALCRQCLSAPLGAAPLATRDLRGKRVL